MIFRRDVSLAATTVAIAASVGLAVAPTASASTVTRTHDGITISTPSSRTVTGSAVTKVTPSVHVKSGAKRKVTKERIVAYRSSGAKVTSGSYVKLHAGSYKVTVTITYRRYTVTHSKRVYGPVHSYTTVRRSLVVHEKSSGGSSGGTTHACTTTSSGSCIRGGEFCPQSSYGQAGYDANGTEFICEGDTTHPHWELP